jgi:hypothetical protein
MLGTKSSPQRAAVTPIRHSEFNMTLFSPPDMCFDAIQYWFVEYTPLFVVF